MKIFRAIMTSPIEQLPSVQDYRRIISLPAEFRPPEVMLRHGETTEFHLKISNELVRRLGLWP